MWRIWFADSLNAYSTLPSSHQATNGKDFHVGGDMRTTLRSSLPDMSKPVKTYPLEKLQTTNKALPEDVDRQHLERHLAREEFEELFEMTPIEFYKLPEWKRINLKRKAKLFWDNASVWNRGRASANTKMNLFCGRNA